MLGTIIEFKILIIIKHDSSILPIEFHITKCQLMMNRFLSKKALVSFYVPELVQAPGATI